MIALQRLNGEAFILNADHIETVESTPDSIIRLINGKTIIAKNSIEDIVRKTIKYKQLCNQTIQVVQQAKGEQDNTKAGQQRAQ
jgi:flagellar protein FlbD